MAGSPRSRPSSARHWSPRCSAALVVALSSCRLPGPPPLTPQLAVQARLLRIEDTRRDEPGFIDSLLASPSSHTRAATALTVGRIGARAHVAALRRLATDPDTGVAANALFALALLKDAASASIAAAALHAGVVPSVEAAFLLGELGELGRAAITSGIGDATISPATRGALLLAAARLRPVPAGAVAVLLTSTDSALAWRAAYALSRGRSTAGARALFGASRSPWATVREQVARGATKPIAGDSLGDMAREALIHLMTDTSARVRVNAVRALSSYGAPVRSAVMVALRDPDAGVRLVAAQSLEPVMDAGATAWTMAFDAETTFAIRRAVADGAIRHGFNLAEHAGWATSDDWRLRAAAAELDARGAAPAAMERLTRWNSDADGRVRAAATGALARLADSASARPLARARLRELLTDTDFGVRSASLGGLARGATADDLRTALASYSIAASDADNDARLAFWQLADTVIARSDVLPGSIQRSLAALARPADPIERLVAARIPRFSAWRDSTGTARPLAWYEDRARESAEVPPKLLIQTDRGTMELILYSREAPLTTWNIVALARRGYFDGQRFHRVVPNFVVQGGDPRGDGNGGPGYAIRDEINRRRYMRGTLGMALSGPNTGGSQFFITHSPQPHLDGGYTVFGELVRGADVLDRIVQGDRIVGVTVH
jgi:cyclophilin family peptidyl-prolyl cis-trans isomerase/HEAT repeat protein